jgi:inner membrane protein
MMATSHMPFALSCYWLFSLAIGKPVFILDSLVALFAGLLPDIDHPQSALGRKLPFISVPLSAIFGHRGFTHSLLAVAIVAGTLIYFMGDPVYRQWYWAIAPLCVGYLSHILGDLLTSSGVPLFYPHKRKYTLNAFTTGDIKEKIAVGLLTIAVLILGGIFQHFINLAEVNIYFQLR